MPRGKKKEDTLAVSNVRESFLNCRAFTQDQVRIAVAEICNREDVDPETAKKITAVLDNVVSNSFSTIMTKTGL